MWPNTFELKIRPLHGGLKCLAKVVLVVIIFIYSVGYFRLCLL